MRSDAQGEAGNDINSKVDDRQAYQIELRPALACISVVLFLLLTTLISIIWTLQLGKSTADPPLISAAHFNIWQSPPFTACLTASAACIFITAVLIAITKGRKTWLDFIALALGVSGSGLLFLVAAIPALSVAHSIVFQIAATVAAGWLLCNIMIVFHGKLDKTGLVLKVISGLMLVIFVVADAFLLVYFVKQDFGKAAICEYFLIVAFAVCLTLLSWHLRNESLVLKLIDKHQTNISEEQDLEAQVVD